MGGEDSVIPAVHFVGFREDREYWSAVRVWGRPGFIHLSWDSRAAREIHPLDVVVHARGEWSAPPSERNNSDTKECAQLERLSEQAMLGRNQD